MENKFTLVLSGGGAYGIAHLGVIEDLEKMNITPSEIVGTSMGGIVGACVAIGMKESEIYKEIETFSNYFKWIKFSFSGNSLIIAEKIEKIFETIFKDKKMKDCSIPLKIIATNLYNGKKKVFTKNDDVFIKDALLATMAIPGIFEEKIIDNIHYVDGMLCENLGVNEATENIILAVDVIGKNSFDFSLPNNFFKTMNIMQMFEKSIRLLMYNQTKTNLKHIDKKVILIEPETKEFKTYQFHKYKEIKEKGKGLLKRNFLK